MEFLGALLVGKPLNSMVVAVIFLVLYCIRRQTAAAGRRTSVWPLAAAAGWVAYATWEWLVVVRTPEANIRVDLLLIYPVLMALSAWALYRLLR